MSHHDPFKSLSPLSWSKDLAPLDPAALADLLKSTLANAQLLIDSIPTPTPPNQHLIVSGRARSHTDSSVPPPSPSLAQSGDKKKGRSKTYGSSAEGERGEEREMVKKLAREWKDVKTGANPHGISMHKLAAKDGKGAWFARRSLHRCSGGMGFEKWEAALRREMEETLVSGNIRGLGAERRMEQIEVEGGEMKVYHVSVKFPGPTTDRDFVTVIMMPETQKKDGRNSRSRQPRQFMIVSRPCDHPNCPPRSGFIRGQYESVELIREVLVEKPLRRTRSSIDLGTEDLKEIIRSSDQERISREAVLRAAKRAVGDEAESEGEQSRTVSFARSPPRSSEGRNEDDMEMAVEWLMVTRSDPGGSVPRFMVEKGTPGGITSDAAKFMKWLSSRSLKDLTEAPETPSGEGREGHEIRLVGEEKAAQVPANTSTQDHLPNGDTQHHNEQPPASGTGIYSLLANALGAAGSAVASRVAAFAPPSLTVTDSDGSDNEDDSNTSDASFASAEEGGSAAANTDTAQEPFPAPDTASTQSAHSTFSSTTTSNALSRETTPQSHAQTQHEKELRKLQRRMCKAQDKLDRAQARRLAKHGNSNNSNNNSTPEDSTAKEDDVVIAKLREKHAREQAKQQEKYQRELQRLADKRAAEERKAAERRKKAAEREERANLQMELDRVKAERDVARKEADMLRERVGELQAQNTRLVARLGREGVVVKEK